MYVTYAFSHVRICDQICKIDLIHASDFLTLKKHDFICKRAIRLSYKYNDRTVLLLNFKALGPIQAELHT